LGVLGNVHDAEDVAQEAMLKGLSKIKKLGKAEQFEAWILQIAKRLCIDLLRRQKRVKRLNARRQMAQSRHSTQESYDLQEAIRQLPQELRLPLTMYYFDNRNTTTIAEKLNVSYSGACRRIRKARRRLHELLMERNSNE
jgi:RNA polymerase sigma-70 factor (ECF subfamily)